MFDNEVTFHFIYSVIIKKYIAINWDFSRSRKTIQTVSISPLYLRPKIQHLSQVYQIQVTTNEWYNSQQLKHKAVKPYACHTNGHKFAIAINFTSCLHVSVELFYFVTYIATSVSRNILRYRLWVVWFSLLFVVSFLHLCTDLGQHFLETRFFLALWLLY